MIEAFCFSLHHHLYNISAHPWALLLLLCN
nr:MAG TPA: hypothetical protein [Caudoviricetes sp.]